MLTLPRLTTERLLLRQFQPSDADTIADLASHPDVVGNISRACIPYHTPAQWIDQQQVNFEEANYLTLAVTLHDDQFIGCVTLTHYEVDDNAELDYWIGKPYWNRGYATEACAPMIDYTFDLWRLHRVFACHFATNPASGRVLQKLGFTREGALRQHYCADNVYEDLVYWGLLRNEWHFV